MDSISPVGRWIISVSWLKPEAHLWYVPILISCCSLHFFTKLEYSMSVILAAFFTLPQEDNNISRVGHTIYKCPFLLDLKFCIAIFLLSELCFRLQSSDWKRLFSEFINTIIWYYWTILQNEYQQNTRLSVHGASPFIYKGLHRALKIVAKKFLRYLTSNIWRMFFFLVPLNLRFVRVQFWQQYLWVLSKYSLVATIWLHKKVWNV